MTRRETLPCANLSQLTELIEIVKNEQIISRQRALQHKINTDDFRLAEILGIIIGKGSANIYFELTKLGKKFSKLSEIEKKMMLFWLLTKNNDIIPPYFRRLVENEETYGVALSTKKICEKLNMKDLWSADILNEWCRYLGVSKGKTKSEVILSKEVIKKLKEGAFCLLIDEEYNRLSGPSKLVPVSKLRVRIKNSGILFQTDDFDNLLMNLSQQEQHKDKISFHPAPVKFVGRGLLGKSGYELISIK